MSDDRTPTGDALSPAEFVATVRRVIARARAKARRIERLAARAELLQVSLVGWQAGHTSVEDRGRDIHEVFELTKDARAEGVIE